jgi:hypothetical protein
VTYAWTVQESAGVTYTANTTSSEFYFKSIGETTNSVNATVSVKISDNLIGTKTFNLSVVRNGEEGAAAVTYQLIPSRNTVHEEDTDKTVTFTV